ncbi:hypothetical protein HHK36_014528 [Tetracentron sinense]|uniref:DUF4408 domain-containing protein n=1 Tax=Tetracentron sinense TaxID=13715 RepID=A0A835DC16_TETSI|nr:hypothetical protein HHK36_014528 [Tetracentron sinense]
MSDLFRNSWWSKSKFQRAIWTIKLAFLSIGIVSTVLVLKFAIPYSFNLLLSTLPRLMISFRSWLSPPYIYIVVNFIIITIAASSTFQQKLSEKKENESDEKKQVHLDSSSQYQKSSPEICIWKDINEIPPESGEKSVILIEKSVPQTWSDISCLTDSGDKPGPNASESARVVRKSTETYRKIVRSTNKPLKSLGVAKPKKHNDTLDATWKAITEGRGKPLTRQLKKSDTWDVTPRVIIGDTEAAAPGRRELKKSETFNDAASSSGSSSSTSRGSSLGGGLMREKSTSRDELNRRVEAFIKKFNSDIRLQRQESYKRYMEMVNRGVY